MLIERITPCGRGDARPDPEEAGTTGRLAIAPLTAADVEPLAERLWHEAVYRHLGGLPAASSAVAAWLHGTLAGPRPDQPPEQWLNYVMRLADGGEIVGLLQATLHEGIAEVAFLLAPAHWGRGLAAEGLRWLHETLGRVSPGVACWATTVPEHRHCQALLARAGYVRAEPPVMPALSTYDEGDWVYCRPGE
ncbi:GNAT family N-acetyltransferase [Pelomonas sp. APW6]|uniref:GNAT family N-acetyltransferase n=1 Tax=Roseateles subflavus TaxID=3053353 RepID=A0ABT7LG57_9BURK|nr:GNAT family N-acetyltransferase [Pelomonas sp. APW6]MDL5031836.1 GNAT family N-acetyltransferase [Pelomonas sp. APW6]